MFAAKNASKDDYGKDTIMKVPRPSTLTLPATVITKMSPYIFKHCLGNLEIPAENLYKICCIPVLANPPLHPTDGSDLASDYSPCTSFAILLDQPDRLLC